jgi:LPXTG-site transpeptidase (sortase) family protein
MGIFFSMAFLLLIIFLGYNFVYICNLDEQEQKTISQFHEQIDVERNDEHFKYSNMNNVQENSDSYTPKKQQTGNAVTVDKDCIIRIPDIDLEKIVYTGTNRETHLSRYELITASDDMQYMNGGNYIICGHASRLYGHSLNRIKEVQKGSLIYIESQQGIDTYTVNNVSFADRYHSSEYYNQSDEAMLTIISCARYVSDTSYIIVQAKLN